MKVKDYNKSAKFDDVPDSLYGAVQLIEDVKRIKFYDMGFFYAYFIEYKRGSLFKVASSI